MISFAIDADELRDAVAAMASCQRALLALAADVDAHHDALHADWTGLAADAHASTHRAWREGCAEMVTALAALRGIAAEAETGYRGAVAANVALWEQVR